MELGLELVLLDPTNPRSLIFQLERLEEHLQELPKSDPAAGELDEEARALLEATSTLKLTRLPHLLQTSSDTRPEVNTLMTQMAGLLREFSRFISDKHFDHRSGPQQLFTTIRGVR